MIKQKSHIVIDAYMLQLGLKGNELLIYALIAGFCQDGVSECWTSQETMAEWCGGISTRAVRDILQNLITKKLITKKECLNKNVKYSYKVVEIVPELSSNEQEVFSTQPELSSGGDRNFIPVVQELSSGNNKIDNIYDNKIDNITIKEKKEIKEKKKDLPETKERVFKKPSVEEISSYCQERNNNINPEQFYDYYEANGWKINRNPMKDWKATVRNWERNEFNRKSADNFGLPIIEEPW